MRTTYVYRPGHPAANERGFVEAGMVERILVEGEGRVPVVTDLYMADHVAPDGTPINSRTKRRAWMRATGAADFSDFTNTRAQGERERQERMTTGGDRKERREQVARALYQHKSRSRR